MNTTRTEYVVESSSEVERVAGIDVHFGTLYTVLTDHDFGMKDIRRLPKRKVARRRRWIATLIAWCQEYNVTRVTMESTSVYHKIVERMFRAAGITVYIVNAMQLKPIQVGKIKQDWRDAARLARATILGTIGPEGLIKPSHRSMNEDEENLKRLCRHRGQISNDLTRVKNRIHKMFATYALPIKEYLGDGWSKTCLFALNAVSQRLTYEQTFERLKMEHSKTNRRAGGLYHSIESKEHSITEFITYALEDLTEYDHAMLRSYLDLFTKYQETLEILDNQIRDLTEPLLDEKNEANLNELQHNLKRRIEIADSLPGVSADLAVKIAVETGDMTRFSNYKKAAKFTGLDPRVKTSGGKGRIGQITKEGSKQLRRHLFLAAMNARLYDRRYRAYYLHLRNTRKLTYRQAICAIARKMMVMYYHLVKNNREYVMKLNRLKCRQTSKETPSEKRRSKKKDPTDELLVNLAQVISKGEITTESLVQLIPPEIIGKLLQEALTKKK